MAITKKMCTETIIKATEFFGNARDLEVFQGQDDGYEQTWRWPDEMGTGSMYRIKLKPGLVLGIGTMQLMESIAISFEEESYPFIFSYGISGCVQYNVVFKEDQRAIFGCRQGHNTITYLPEWQGVARPPTGTPVSWLGIFIDPLLLSAFIGRQHNRMPGCMCDILDGADDKAYYHVTTTAPLADMAIQQILDCPYQGPIKRLYLESKVLELIAHSLTRLSPVKDDLKNSFQLRPQDIERTHHAKELIQRNLEAPPKLLDLAKDVGLSHPKLNYCFRQIYGTTIFGFLRQARLVKAKSLLADGRMNVTEAAYAVGYSSLSHFAKSFKEFYGTPPGHYLRSVSNKW